MLAVALSIGVIVADHRQHHLDALRATLSVVVYPLHYLASLPDMLARKVEGRMAREEQLREHNEALRRDNLILNARLQKFEALESENMRLRDLLGSSFKIGDRVLIACDSLKTDLADAAARGLEERGVPYSTAIVEYDGRRIPPELAGPLLDDVHTVVLLFFTESVWHQPERRAAKYERHHVDRFSAKIERHDDAQCADCPGGAGR